MGEICELNITFIPIDVHQNSFGFRKDEVTFKKN